MRGALPEGDSLSSPSVHDMVVNNTVDRVCWTVVYFLQEVCLGGLWDSVRCGVRS